ncbi:MAG: hypothetical protein HQL57_08500 [Magnetococcales bacterium]|nr:hypothetical protein [Magnetococcales bacterium]MBF0157207.1 hypothetical protein [Magnetococcales bacterium]
MADKRKGNKPPAAERGRIDPEDEIQALARMEAPESFRRIVDLAQTAASEQTRLAAEKEILNRAFGRADLTRRATEEGEGADAGRSFEAVRPAQTLEEFLHDHGAGMEASSRTATGGHPRQRRRS